MMTTITMMIMMMTINHDDDAHDHKFFSAQPLLGDEPAEPGSGTGGIAGNASLTIGLAAALAAIVAALLVVGIALAIRFFRNRHQVAKYPIGPTRSSIFTPSASSFGTVNSRYSLPQSALDDGDSVANSEAVVGVSS